MKKQSIILGMSALCTLHGLQGQNIGISATPSNPDPSAGLDINFTNRGLLIPRVALTSATDAATIPSPAASLLVYNTGTGGLSPAGYYYNSGTPVSPNWVRLMPATGVLTTCGGILTNYVQKWNGTQLCNSIIFDNGTNVGIGTTTPAQKLDVSGNVQFSGALMPGGNAGTAGQVLTSQGAGLPPVWQTPGGGGGGDWSLTGNAGTVAGTNFLGTTDAQDLVIKVNSTEAARFFNSMPGYLRVYSISANLGLLQVGGSSGTAQFNVGGKFGIAGTGMNMRLYIDDGSGLNGTLTINNAGPGKTDVTIEGDVYPTTDNQRLLGKSGFRWSAVWAANGTIQTSDLRFKKNIRPLTYGLKEVLKLNPVFYQWKNDTDNIPKIGLIAQEVQSIIKEAVIVGDDENHNLGLNYSYLVPVLIQAIKELKMENEQLKSIVQQNTKEIMILKSNMNSASKN